jgi:hypothetical protein
VDDGLLLALAWLLALREDTATLALGLRELESVGRAMVAKAELVDEGEPSRAGEGVTLLLPAMPPLLGVLVGVGEAGTLGILETELRTVTLGEEEVLREMEGEAVLLALLEVREEALGEGGVEALVLALGEALREDVADGVVSAEGVKVPGR